MITLNAIRQNIISMEYGFTKPKSLVVLIPVVSLIFQKIQVSEHMLTLNTASNTSYEYWAVDNPQHLKLDSIYKWHGIGSLIQTIILVSLLTFHPLFLIPTVFSIYEMYTCSKGITHTLHMNQNALNVS